jgi:hypothetical protein
LTAIKIRLFLLASLQVPLSTTSAGDCIVTAAAACWPFECGIAKEHDENQLLRISVPAEIIHQAIWLYLRFTLSFRGVEDLLAERGLRSLTRPCGAG